MLFPHFSRSHVQPLTCFQMPLYSWGQKLVNSGSAGTPRLRWKKWVFNWTVHLTAVCSMIRVHLETIVHEDFKYSLHHTTAVDRQSGEGIIDVCHILSTPQPLCHSTGARPSSKRTSMMKLLPYDVSRLKNTSIFLRRDHEGVTWAVSYQSLGVRLVASTYSPHRHASPPITSFFCSSVPVSKCSFWWDQAAQPMSRESEPPLDLMVNSK